MSGGWLPDLFRCLSGFIACVAIGLLTNQFRSAGLPLIYSNPEDRLELLTREISTNNVPRGSPLPSVSKKELTAISRNSSALILDARPIVFFNLGHIPNALSLSRETFKADYKTLQNVLEQNRYKPIVIYCANGDCPDSQRVGEALRRLGFPYVRIFPGGWEEWAESPHSNQQGCHCGDD